MFFAHDGTAIVSSEADEVRVHHLDEAREEVVRVPGHRIVAVDASDSALRLVTTDGERVLAWPDGPTGRTVDLAARIRALGAYRGREALHRLGVLATAAHAVGPAVFHDRQGGEHSAEANVVFAVGTSLVAAQLDYFPHRHVYRCVDVSPPGDQEPYERRLVAWRGDPRCTRAVTTRADGCVWVGEPMCVEAAFDASWPRRCVVDGVAPDDVEDAAIAPGPERGYRYAIAVPDGYVVVSTRDDRTLAREPDRMRESGDHLVGLTVGGAVLVVRDRQLLELGVDGERSHPSPAVLAAAVGPVGGIVALRVEGDAGLRRLDFGG